MTSLSWVGVRRMARRPRSVITPARIASQAARVSVRPIATVMVAAAPAWTQFGPISRRVANRNTSTAPR